MPGKVAVIREEGKGLVVEPVTAKPLLEVLASLPLLGEAVPEIPDAKPRAVGL